MTVPDPVARLGPPPNPGPAIPVQVRPDDLYSVARHFLRAQDECARLHDRLCQRMAAGTQIVGKDSSAKHSVIPTAERPLPPRMVSFVPTACCARSVKAGRARL